MGTNKERQLLEQLFTDLTQQDHPHRLRTSISDLFVRVNTQTGEISLYGDDDELLHSVTIFSWITNTPAPQAEMIDLLRLVLSDLDTKGYWSNELFDRPFSVELVSDDFSTIEHLLLVDDELIGISSPLLSGLHEDLEKFLQDLLGDMK